jgi:hypothetical protein
LSSWKDENVPKKGLITVIMVGLED